ncbi:LPD7 domain-containing protein [Klebsiella pneumoniae]|uniref:LPD7 domain-containing protein n=1 Tax=Klebsiella pneumoniae TaxID=573 RepID=UPI001D0EF8F5
MASAPAAAEPEEAAPVASAHAAAEPEDAAPVASAPAAAEPEEAAPVASAPAAAEPEEAAPVASAHAAAEPEEAAPVEGAAALSAGLLQVGSISSQFMSETNASVMATQARQGTAGMLKNNEDGTYDVLIAITDSENDEDVYQLTEGESSEVAQQLVAFLNGNDLSEVAAQMRKQLDIQAEASKQNAVTAENVSYDAFTQNEDDYAGGVDDLEAYAAMMGAAGMSSDKPVKSDKPSAHAENVDEVAGSVGQSEILTEKKKPAEEAENGIRWATNDNAETPPKERIDLEGLIARFGYRAEKDYTAYTLDGHDAFYDYGSHLRMANPEASQSDEMILAAVLTADKQHHRGIEITGSDEFKERVFNLISEYNIDVKLTNPEQRVKLLELKKANEKTKENAPESDSKNQKNQSEKIKSPEQKDGMRWDESASVQPKKQNASDTQKEDKAAGESWEKGVIVAHGRAKYEWKEDESMNYFVTLKNEHGEKTLWGKDLERAVKDAGVDAERLVTVRKLGFVDVEVNAPVRDESNKIVRYETIQTKRNEWEVKPVYPQPTAGNEQAYKPSELVPYDAATFQKLRTTIQQITGVDLSREAVPEKELYWFLPNGKPAPESMTKPAGYKLPQESKTAGTPLLIAPHKKGERPDYFLVESRKGFMQGIAKDKESGEYHSVIGKVNKRIDKDGNWKTYMTLSAINKNAESGIVLHGYGHVDQGGKNLLYKNTIANEKQPQHLQPASDEVKNKTVMKQLFHPSNAAKRKDDERREQTHAPVAKSAPRP